MINSNSLKKENNLHTENSVKELMKKFETSDSKTGPLQIKNNINTSFQKSQAKKNPYFGTLKHRTVVTATSCVTDEQDINMDSKVAVIDNSHSKPICDVIQIFGGPAKKYMNNLTRLSISDNLNNNFSESTANTSYRKSAPPIAPKPAIFPNKNTLHTNHIVQPEKLSNSNSLSSLAHSSPKSENVTNKSGAVILESSTVEPAIDRQAPLSSSSSVSEDSNKCSATYNIACYDFDTQEKPDVEETSVDQTLSSKAYSNLIPTNYSAIRDENGNLILSLPEPCNKSSILSKKITLKKSVRFNDNDESTLETYNEEEYERGDNDVDPVTASAEYELEKAVEKLTTFDVEITKDSKGLGLSIVGKGLGTIENNERLGIFVKSLASGGAAELSGKIQVNDQIIEVNGINLVGVSQQVATQSLRNTSTIVKFLIGRKMESEA